MNKSLDKKIDNIDTGIFLAGGFSGMLAGMGATYYFVFLDIVQGNQYWQSHPANFVDYFSGFVGSTPVAAVAGLIAAVPGLYLAGNIAAGFDTIARKITKCERNTMFGGRKNEQA